MENIRREVRELRVILESVEAKNKERVWLKNQASGDLDDTKMYVKKRCSLNCIYPVLNSLLASKA